MPRCYLRQPATGVAQRPTCQALRGPDRCRHARPDAPGRAILAVPPPPLVGDATAGRVHHLPPPAVVSGLRGRHATVSPATPRSATPRSDPRARRTTGYRHPRPWLTEPHPGPTTPSPGAAHGGSAAPPPGLFHTRTDVLSCSPQDIPTTSPACPPVGPHAGAPLRAIPQHVVDGQESRAPHLVSDPLTPPPTTPTIPLPDRASGRGPAQGFGPPGAVVNHGPGAASAARSSRGRHHRGGTRRRRKHGPGSGREPERADSIGRIRARKQTGRRDQRSAAPTSGGRGAP